MNDPSRGNNEGMQMKIYGKCVFQLCLKTCVYIYICILNKYIYTFLSLSLMIWDLLGKSINIYIYIEIRYLYAYKHKTCEGTNHMEIFAT